MSTEKMNAEFEIWRNEQITSLIRTGHVQAARAFHDLGSIHWMAWQSAWTLSRAAIEVELPREDRNIDYSGYISKSETEAAIESIGLKVKP